jgi:WD40 repeat protein
LINLGAEIARGGEGVIFRVIGDEDLLAKVYSPLPHPGYESKLKWMSSNPPKNPSNDQTPHLAWPMELLYDEKNNFTGYLMPYLKDTVPILDVFNPRRRTLKLPDFTRKHLHRAARNLAAMLASIHARDYVVGDLNESNILIDSSAMVALIDNDSFQVQSHLGGQIIVYPCPVGKPEYTPPELQDKLLSDTLRRPEHDSFALGVLIFQLLMNGNHPFRSRWLRAGDPPSMEEKIKRGYFPYARTFRRYAAPPPNAPTLRVLHPALYNLVLRCFVDGSRDVRLRPSPMEWEWALRQAEDSLVICNRNHFYSKHLKHCPECVDLDSPVGRTLWVASSVPISMITPKSQLRSGIPDGAGESGIKKESSIKKRLVLSSAAAIGLLLLAGLGVWSVNRQLDHRNMNQIIATKEKEEAIPADNNDRSMIEESATSTQETVLPSSEHTLIADVNKDDEDKSKLARVATYEGTGEKSTETVKSEASVGNKNSSASTAKKGKDSNDKKVDIKNNGKREQTGQKNYRESPEKLGNKTNDLPVAANFNRKITVQSIRRLVTIGLMQGHRSAISSICFSPTENLLATGSLDNTTRLWKPADGSSVGMLKTQKGVVGVAFSPDGKVLALGSGKNLDLCQPSDRKIIASLGEHKRTLTCLAFSPDGYLLATGSTDNNVRIWRVKDGDLLYTFTGHTWDVTCVAFSPDGKTLASGSDDNTVRLWNIKAGTVTAEFNISKWDVVGIDFSPDGKLLAVASKDETIRIWRVKERSLFTTLHGHEDTITSLTFSPDGQLLVSGSKDKTLRLWDVRKSDLVMSLNCENPVRSVAFSPNGEYLASGLYNGDVKLWAIEDGIEFASIPLR